jgi:hypothetical protein
LLTGAWEFRVLPLIILVWPPEASLCEVGYPELTGSSQHLLLWPTHPTWLEIVLGYTWNTLEANFFPIQNDISWRSEAVSNQSSKPAVCRM